MSNELVIVVIGGLANGQVIYDYFLNNRYVGVPLVITYTDEDKRLSCTPDTRVISDLDANKYTDDIKKINPDYIFVAGWSGLLNGTLLSLGASGTVGFHPSMLPKDRGRSVLAWQIEEGYENTGLSMFYYDVRPDAGDIVAQEKIAIHSSDSVLNVLDKVTLATKNLITSQFPMLRQGLSFRTPQDHSQATFRRLRTDSDSMIDWESDAQSIYNKVRAITRPYPGAICKLEGKKYRVWSVEICSFNINLTVSVPVGEIACRLFDDTFLVKVRDGYVRVMSYEVI
jgi:methionyl-tRNA formyltransferase